MNHKLLVLTKLLLFFQDIFDIKVLELDTLECQNSCSGHGKCQQASRVCICEPFWIENFVRKHLMDGKSNCGKWRENRSYYKLSKKNPTFFRLECHLRWNIFVCHCCWNYLHSNFHLVQKGEKIKAPQTICKIRANWKRKVWDVKTWVFE